MVVCKIFKWYPTLGYPGNHNAPHHDGVCSNKHMDFTYHPHARNRKTADQQAGLYNALPNDAVQFIHMGFASIAQFRLAKNKYYAERGETETRPRHVNMRDYFRHWVPGDPRPGPHGNDNLIMPYSGPIPEVFK